MREKFRDQFFRAWKIEGDKLFSDTKSSFKSGEKSAAARPAKAVSAKMSADDQNKRRFYLACAVTKNFGLNL